ncbi:MAG: hypothetical protein A4E20_08965 [Nitrospira sp. SG-bin2]|nr:MAG: hypothetical protein A4E20_08965 [Nitrospira sp. SG-bin2]
MVAVENRCLCKLSACQGEGGIHGLTGCTEPRTERIRMALRVMVPVIELVHDQVRADQDDRGEQHPCQHDHERQSEWSMHRQRDPEAASTSRP